MSKLLHHNLQVTPTNFTSTSAVQQNIFQALPQDKICVSKMHFGVDHSEKTSYTLNTTGSSLYNYYKDPFLKKELIRPTRIYVKEILKLVKKDLLNGCANITGGGLADNIRRVIPNNLCAEINLKKIKTLKIFSWLKSNKISDKEMLKTFNCGVGFCLIVNPKNLVRVKKYFVKEFQPYVIGKIAIGKNRVKLNEKIDWS